MFNFKPYLVELELLNLNEHVRSRIHLLSRRFLEVPHQHLQLKTDLHYPQHFNQPQGCRHPHHTVHSSLFHTLHHLFRRRLHLPPRMKHIALAILISNRSHLSNLLLIPDLPFRGGISTCRPPGCLPQPARTLVQFSLR